MGSGEGCRAVIMKRDEAMDFVKGAAIVLMVAGHAATDWEGFKGFSNWFNLFHMPVFLFVAGWFFKSSCCENLIQVRSFVWKKILRLWWPCFLWSELAVLAHNALIRLNIHTDNPRFLELFHGRLAELNQFYDTGQMLCRCFETLFSRNLDRLCGAMWFVLVLLIVLCGYCAVSCLLRMAAHRLELDPDETVVIGQSAIAVVSVLMAKYWMPASISRIIFFAGGEKTLTSYFLFHIGVLLRSFDLRSDKLTVKWQVPVVVASCIVSCGLLKFGTLSLITNSYPSICHLVVGAFCGWFLLLSMSRFPGAGLLAFIGQHSMAILIFHFLAFKIVNFVGVLLCHDEFFMIAGWPTTYSGPGWFMAYVVVGTGVPVLLSVAYEKMLCRYIKANIFST